MDKIWKFRLDYNYERDLAPLICKISDSYFCDFINSQKEIVGYICDGVLNIFEGYEWDGCTPKFLLFGITFGTPDFKETWAASLVHDFLIEYSDQHKITRKEIDIIFEKILYEKKFKFRFIYSWGVHLFRIFYINIFRKTTKRKKRE